MPTKIPRIGKSTIWAINPAKTGFGLLNSKLKSDNLSSSPIPAIIKANEKGRTTALKNELSIILKTGVYVDN